MWEKAIVYSCIDNYYAQVEEMMFPSLKERVMVVGEGNVVLSVNELAKDYNIQIGDTLEKAKIKCPHIVIISPHYEDYKFYQELIKNIYREYSDKVESLENGEIWIDLTSYQWVNGGHPIDIAKDMQERIYRELGIRVSCGVSFNQLFAKLAIGGKTGLHAIVRRFYKRDAYPLRLVTTPYLSETELDILCQNDIYTVGAITYRSREMMVSLLGQIGGILWDIVHGENIEESSRYEEDIQVIGKTVLTCGDLSYFEETMQLCESHIINLARHLKEYRISGKKISIRMRDHDFRDYILERQLVISTNECKTLYRIVEMLLRECCMNQWSGEFDRHYQSLTIMIGDISYDEIHNEYIQVSHQQAHSILNVFKHKLSFKSLSKSLG